MKLRYKTRLSNLKKGDRPCYQAWVVHGGTRSKGEIVKEVSLRSGLPDAVVDCVLRLFFETVREEVRDGFRFDTGDVSGAAYVQGTFGSLDDPWDASRHRLVVRLNAKGALRDALKGHTPVNVTEGAKVSVKSVLDVDHAVDGAIYGTSDVAVRVSGVGLAVDAEAGDEGVWLEDATGAVIARASVAEASDTMLDCTFAELPADGAYTFVVASRGGLGAEYGVAMGRRKVSVAANPDA